jgi:hypothetical protein
MAAATVPSNMSLMDLLPEILNAVFGYVNLISASLVQRDEDQLTV